MDETRTDGELIAAVRSGEQAAFATLFERWADRCYDVARRILHDEGRAAEVTQEVFTMAWQQLATLRDPDAFGGWILRMSRNKALDRLRHEQRAVPTDGTDPSLRDLRSGRSVEDEAGALDHQELVWAAAQSLGERDASILDLHLRHDLSVPEIAEELGVTTNNAHQLLFRMKQRLATGIRAYVLVRGGDASCPGLRAQLAEANVTRFGPEAVKVIGAHVKACDDCDRKQAAVLAPEALFAAAPIAVLAPALRAQVAHGLQSAGVPAGGGAAPSAAGPSADLGPGSGSGGPGSPGGVGGALEGAPVPPSSEPAASGSGGAGRGSGRSRAAAVGGAAAAVLLILVGLFFLTRGGDDGTEVAGPRSTTTVPDGRGGGGGETTTTTARQTTTTQPTTGDLEGSWVADANDILGANTANVGGPGALSCSGPITMTFTAEGTFDRSGDVTCSAGGMSRSGRVASSGRYETSGDQLTVSAMASTGTSPDAFGNGTATYEVSGDTLTITFANGSVGTVTQTYQRA